MWIILLLYVMNYVELYLYIYSKVEVLYIELSISNSVKYLDKLPCSILILYDNLGLCRIKDDV